MLTDYHNSFIIRLSIKHIEVIKDPTLPQTRRYRLHYLMKSKYQETTDNLKEMSRSTININLIYYS